MNIKRNRLFAMGAVALSIFLLAASASAESGRRALRGLKGVSVVVEKLDPAVEKDGLTRDVLRKDTISALRRAGIRVFSRKEWLKASGNPQVYVNANVLKLAETGEYIYTIHIALKENVYLLREPIEIWGATTWTKGGTVGITGRLEKIRTAVKRQVAAF
ncbi:MAG: hypothetical protein JRJ60_04990, partial [Deltaproteobacteria bacterium]|nr:hypothetical protein [Deltaproteobacteria bacterium]